MTRATELAALSRALARRSGTSGMSARALLLAFTAALLPVATPALAGPFYSVTNLVSDDKSVVPALLEDPRITNAWGLVTSGTSPFWLGDNGADNGLDINGKPNPTGKSTLISVSAVTGAVSVLPTPFDIVPGVTGVVNNNLTTTTATQAQAFNGDNFLFVSENGTVSGRRGTLDPNPESFNGGPSAANIYKGTAFATIASAGVTHGYLYAANFKTGNIDVIKGDAGAPNLAGNFTDPLGVPAGYAPFNIRQINGKLYVTYAKQGGGADELDGAGLGLVDVFNLDGTFVARIANPGGTLDAPWGLAIAPTSFGMFGGDLLVGNFGDGTINAFKLNPIDFTGTFDGQLLGDNGLPISIDGLWALSFGGGGTGQGGRIGSLYFTAGPNDEQNGLFGVIESVPEPSTLAMFGFGLLGLGFMMRRRSVASQ